MFFRHHHDFDSENQLKIAKAVGTPGKTVADLR